MEGIFRRRRLPHWDVADATYFVTTCLNGSIPSQGISALKRFRRELDHRSRPTGTTESTWEHTKHKLVFKFLDDWLDSRPVVRHLEKAHLAKQVCDSIHFFAGVRYHLLAWVVMPSHFHWVFQPTSAYCDEVAANEDNSTPRERIMKSVKGFSARQCNALLGVSGIFWQDESYDHCVRNHDELLRIIDYIEMNPVKAGLVTTPADWCFSSAKERAEQGVAIGDPLLVKFSG